jgi:pentatricopeptide repeat protein
VRVAGEVSKLTAHLAQGRGLSRADYLAMISSQFWLKQDHEQLLQTVAAMKAAGFSLDASTLQQLLNVYCHNGMWGEALQVLNDVAAGRFRNSTVGAGAQQANSRQQQHGARRQQGVNGAGGSSSSRGVGGGGLEDDKLWHVVMRKLWEKKASDELLNEFLRHMAPAQLQRFKLMYGLEVLPGGGGPEQRRYTLQGSLEDWQRPLAAAPAAPAGFKQQSRRQEKEEEEVEAVEGGEEHFLLQDGESGVVAT